MEKNKDNPAVSIIMTFQDGAKLAYVFKKPVPQLNFLAALGTVFGKMGIEMPELEIPPQPGEPNHCPKCGANVIARQGFYRGWPLAVKREFLIAANHCPKCGAWEATCDGKTIKCLKCGHEEPGVSWEKDYE